MTLRPPYFKRAAAWLLLLGPLFYLSYGLANWWAATRGSVPSVAFGWERHIPFLSWTIFPYWSLNFFYALSLFLGRSRHAIDRHGARLLTAQVIAVACFVAWPLQFGFGQPEVSGPPGLLFDALRGFDQPFNQAPSLHIVLTVILWDWYQHRLQAPWARAVLHVWAMLIGISVLTTYQHHFLDIPTGMLLGMFCVWLWPLERRLSMPATWRWTTVPKRLCLGAAYAAGAALCLGVALWLGGWGLWLAWPAAALSIVALNYLGLGARGFGMDGHGRMHWAVRWLLAPYRIAAAINARLWTLGQAPAHEVLPGVWLGRMPTAREWRNAGQPVIVSLCAELQPPSPARAMQLTHCLPLLDLVAPTPQQLQLAASRIEAAYRQSQHSGRPLLVCCALGYARSAAALMAWLLHTGQQASVVQAHALLRSVRPRLVVQEPVTGALAALLSKRVQT
ncbi:putative protein YnbD [uncultured Comamonas sp.]|nr:putative protein YnbD [uncultured Comamonas sp.]